MCSSDFGVVMEVQDVSSSLQFVVERNVSGILRARSPNVMTVQFGLFAQVVWAGTVSQVGMFNVTGAKPY